MLEKEIVDRLIRRENLIATKEFDLGKAGFIDILTKEEIIEVKELSSWKHAIGQVLVYHAALGDKRKKMRIHLFKRNGEAIDEDETGIIERICREYCVDVTWEGKDYLVRKNRIDSTLDYLDKFRFVDNRSKESNHLGRTSLKEIV